MTRICGIISLLLLVAMMMGSFESISYAGEQGQGKQCSAVARQCSVSQPKKTASSYDNVSWQDVNQQRADKEDTWYGSLLNDG